MSYAQDYDERLVPNYLYSPPGVALFWWYDMLQPYINNEQLFICPSSTPGSYTYLRPPGRPNPARFSYAVNALYLSMGGNSISLGSIVNPSETV